MPAVSKPWRFAQLGGERKEFVLSGLDAPHGRPRQRPVVVDPVEVRENTVYYAGNSAPTRHLFGVKYDQFELQGRIADRNPTSSNPSLFAAGTGYAKAFVDWIKRFVADQQQVTVQWGDVLSAKGLVKRFEPRREAEYEVEYTLIVLIDSDETTPARVSPLNSRRSPTDAVNHAVAALLAVTDALPSSDSIKPSLLDALDSAITLVTSATGVLVDAAANMNSIEHAISADILRLRAGIGQVRTASLSLQDTLEAFEVDAATIRRSASTDIDWGSIIASNATSVTAALASLEDLDKQAEIAQRGKTFSSYVARRGDTWESIGASLLGSPDQAQNIKDANGIRRGELPQAGRSYKIPFAL